MLTISFAKVEKLVLIILFCMFHYVAKQSTLCICDICMESRKFLQNSELFLKALQPLIYYLIGWVNLYQKFEIEKYTRKKWKGMKNFFCLAQLACEFAWICKYL